MRERNAPVDGKQVKARAGGSGRMAMFRRFLRGGGWLMLAKLAVGLALGLVLLLEARAHADGSAGVTPVSSPALIPVGAEAVVG